MTTRQAGKMGEKLAEEMREAAICLRICAANNTWVSLASFSSWDATQRVEGSRGRRRKKKSEM
jgi:hypothetical protein